MSRKFTVFYCILRTAYSQGLHFTDTVIATLARPLGPACRRSPRTSAGPTASASHNNGTLEDLTLLVATRDARWPLHVPYPHFLFSPFAPDNQPTAYYPNLALWCACHAVRNNMKTPNFTCEIRRQKRWLNGTAGRMSGDDGDDRTSFIGRKLSNRAI